MPTVIHIMLILKTNTRD